METRQSAARRVAPPRSLVQYYDCKRRGAVWEFRCKSCQRGWSLPVSDSPHVGNILYLLNHARGHEENRA